MSEDRDEIRRRLESMHEPTQPSADAAPPERPARPASPARRPPAPIPQRGSGDGKPPTIAPVVVPPRDRAVVSPQAPRLTGVPAEPAGDWTPDRRADDVRAAARRAAGREARANRRAAIAQTLFPPSLTLGLSLPLLAIGWFVLDPSSILRDNALGFALPALLGLGGLVFIGLTVLFVAQSRPDRSV